MKITVNPSGLAFPKRIREAIKSTINSGTSKFAKQAGEILKQDVVESIKRGNSPVKGFGRYNDYSKSYKDAINAGRYNSYNKKLRPINLTLSGRMLKLIAIRQTLRGITLTFTSKLAKYHNELGAGKSKAIRRMYPKGSEQFKESVMLGINKFIAKEKEEEIIKKLRSF